MVGTEDTLYNEIVRITGDYLGPAAERFIARQIRSHLHKDPTTLATDDLNDLIEWVRVTISVLTEDNYLVSQYIKSLRQLQRVILQGTLSEDH